MCIREVTSEEDAEREPGFAATSGSLISAMLLG
jgi:hypothetical protein